MLYTPIREALVKYGNQLVSDGYTLGTGGNLSCYVREEAVMLITPSGIEFHKIRPEDIVVLKLDGTVVEGEKKPSTEWIMHKLFYEQRKDINAVIHAHTIYSTVLAVLRKPLPASHYMLAVAGKDIRCADYASYGTLQLAENAFKAMENRKACLLANHGILTGAQDLANAYNVLEEVEYCAKIHVLAESIGKPVIIDDEEIANIHERFKTYGQIE